MFIHIIHYLYGLSNKKRDEYLIEKIADKWQDFVILHLFDLRLIKGERQSTGGVGLLLFECDIDITV